MCKTKVNRGYWYEEEIYEEIYPGLALPRNPLRQPTRGTGEPLGICITASHPPMHFLDGVGVGDRLFYACHERDGGMLKGYDTDSAL
jgi:hypothetical protein